MTANEPQVKTASAYYQQNIGKVSSIDDFVGNYRLLSYALNAYGLGDQINSKALISKVLQGGTSDPKSLANTLPNQHWVAFAKAFESIGQTGNSVSSPDSIKTTENNYVENQLEDDQGTQAPGVQLALYFQRVAPTVSSAYGILADKDLLQVVQTVFNLPPETGATNIDAQASIINRLLPMSDLQDPKKLQQLVTRFTAMSDATYGPTSGTSAGQSGGATSAASMILGNILNANGASLTSLSATSSSQLFSSLQGLSLGG
jgi:hypothetical protein